MKLLPGLRALTAAALLALLAACGGGGGDAGKSPFDDGTPVAKAPADLLVALDKISIGDSGSESVSITVTAVDTSRVAISGVPIALSVNNQAVIATVSSATTGTDGKVTGTVQIGADKSNRVVTVTAKADGIERSVSFSVVGAKLAATVGQPVLAPGATGRIQYRLTDVTGAAIGGAAISISGAGIAGATDATNANGEFVFTYQAPTQPTQLTVTASAGGVTSQEIVVVQAGTSIPPVTAAITSKSVSVNPSVVLVNSITSTNRAEVRALFLGAANAPLANVRVRFDLGGDPNSIGGSIASDVVYSDANGIATAAYVPGTRSSPTDGVTVRACYYTTDAAASANLCPDFVTTTLTVVNETVAVSIGTDNTITDGAGGLAYIKKYVVLVVDASGKAKANVPITPSIDLIEYLRGYYATPAAWTRASSGGGYTATPCANEDQNRNGVLEVGEDINGNSQLDPRKSDVTISMMGTGLTDNDGAATLQILYPKSVATWINFRITVSASGVSGTEGRAEWVGQLPAAASEFVATTPPSFAVSPYGQGQTVVNGTTTIYGCSDTDPTASNQPKP